MIENVAVGAHVIRELGHVSTLPGEGHPRGGVVNDDDGRAHLVASAHRLPGTRTDVLAKAEGGSQRRGPVPEFELRTVTVCGRAACPTPQTPTCAQAGREDAQSSQRCRAPRIESNVKRPGSDEQLSIINKPFAADALGLKRVGDALARVSVTRVPCSAPWLVAKAASVGRDVTESDQCCHSLQAEASGKCAGPARRLGVAEQVDQIQVGRDQRLG